MLLGKLRLRGGFVVGAGAQMPGSGLRTWCAASVGGPKGALTVESKSMEQAQQPQIPAADRQSDDLVVMDLDTFEQLQRVQAQLHGGTDRERDFGHRLWLLLGRAERCPAAICP